MSRNRTGLLLGFRLEFYSLTLIQKSFRFVFFNGATLMKSVRFLATLWQICCTVLEGIGKSSTYLLQRVAESIGNPLKNSSEGIDTL
jgi:hypothetical protein